MSTADGTARLRAMVDVRARAIEAVPPRTQSSTPPGIPDRRHARASAVLPDDDADFPKRFVPAMHEAARSYRARLAEELELRRVAVMTGIRDERRAEALTARKAAAQNRRAVDAWATTAQRQVKSERQRRKVEIAAELRRTLRVQNQAVEQRVKGIEAALAAYCAELDAFFEAIEKERDPLTIAQRARRTPAFPALDVTTSTDEPTRPPATE
jgi:hypothetical protein